MCKLQRRARSICAQHILNGIIGEQEAEAAEELIIGIDIFYLPGQCEIRLASIWLQSL